MLDPFLGIGNAAIAAKVCRIGRFVGFDVDSEYVRVARGNVRAAPDKIDEPAEFAADPQLF